MSIIWNHLESITGGTPFWSVVITCELVGRDHLRKRTAGSYKLSPHQGADAVPIAPAPDQP
jgi:hypothetical protein